MVESLCFLVASTTHDSSSGKPLASDILWSPLCLYLIVVLESQSLVEFRVIIILRLCGTPMPTEQVVSTNLVLHPPTCQHSSSFNTHFIADQLLASHILSMVLLHNIMTHYDLVSWLANPESGTGGTGTWAVVKRFLAVLLCVWVIDIDIGNDLSFTFHHLTWANWILCNNGYKGGASGLCQVQDVYLEAWYPEGIVEASFWKISLSASHIIITTYFLMNPHFCWKIQRSIFPTYLQVLCWNWEDHHILTRSFWLRSFEAQSSGAWPHSGRVMWQCSFCLVSAQACRILQTYLLCSSSC